LAGLSRTCCLDCPYLVCARPRRAGSLPADPGMHAAAGEHACMRSASLKHHDCCEHVILVAGVTALAVSRPDLASDFSIGLVAGQSIWHNNLAAQMSCQRCVAGAEQGASATGADHLLQPAAVERRLCSCTGARRQHGALWLGWRPPHSSCRPHCLQENMTAASKSGTVSGPDFASWTGKHVINE
jgi:hypothetical protein